MNKAATTAIRFTTTKAGQRQAYRAGRHQARWFRMPLADAELAIATGTARDETAEWNATFRGH